MKGKFITLEGVEGVGKSTNIEFIESLLTENAIRYIKTREPGGTPLAELIRELLLQKRDEAFDGTAELLLIFSARSQHLQEKIIPALQTGTWVLSDRFTDATYAYQGGGRQLSMTTISALENIVQGALRPDLTIILDLPVEIGLQRAAKRSDKDRFESEGVDFFERVRAAYLARVQENPSRYALVDASRSLPEVQEQIRYIINTFCKQ
jgi:dTMP kinase